MSNQFKNVYEIDVCINKGVRYRVSENSEWITIKNGPISGKEMSTILTQAIIAYESINSNNILLTNEMITSEFNKHFQ